LEPLGGGAFIRDAAVTSKSRLFDTPAVLWTVIAKIAGIARDAAGIVADSAMSLSNVVASALPEHRIVSPSTNPVPVTEMGVSGEAATVVAGRTAESTGGTGGGGGVSSNSYVTEWYGSILSVIGAPDSVVSGDSPWSVNPAFTYTDGSSVC
jgi:hypothetical protein